MPRYFFDLRSGDVISIDDEGMNLPDVGSAHSEAIGALATSLRDIMVVGGQGQHLAVEVRDELGPVFEASAVLGTKILRKQ
jgi:hypothetical protein